MSDVNTSVAKVCEVLRNRYPEPLVALGSELGALIQKEYPEINLKAAFGGLRVFLNKYLSHYITEIGSRGADIEYRVDFLQKSGAYGSISDISPLAQIDENKVNETIVTLSSTSQHVNLWHALVNPKTLLRCFWITDNQHLIFLDPNEPAPARGLELATVSFQDHVQITKNFLLQKALSISNSEADPSDMHGYVPKIVQILRVRGLQSEWEKFRVDAILKLVSSRLQALGITFEASTKVIDDLRSAKAMVRTPSKLVSTPIPHPNRTTQDGEAKLRAFLSRAVTQMSIEELRGLTISGFTLEKTLNMS